MEIRVKGKGLEFYVYFLQCTRSCFCLIDNSFCMLVMHRTRTAVRGSNRTVRVRILEFGFEFESEFDLRVRGRVRDLKFGSGFEFENYPINLAGIECLSDSPSIFFL